MTIATQIEIRMKAKNMSIMTLESKAGLKTHAVRNILRGKSKNPSAVNLQAIADALECTVKDLLTVPAFLLEDLQVLPLEEILQMKYTIYAKDSLFREVIATVEALAQNHKKNLTIEQFLICIREIYLRSLQKDPTRVNEEFSEWFLKLMAN